MIEPAPTCDMAKLSQFQSWNNLRIIQHMSWIMERYMGTSFSYWSIYRISWCLCMNSQIPVGFFLSVTWLPLPGIIGTGDTHAIPPSHRHSQRGFGLKGGWKLMLWTINLGHVSRHLDLFVKEYHWYIYIYTYINVFKNMHVSNYNSCRKRIYLGVSHVEVKILRSLEF